MARADPGSLRCGLEERLSTGPISAYVGFDASGPSLHVGHLVPMMALVHLQRHGGRPVAVVGGGTGMIGDPSGKSAERVLLTAEQVDANAVSIRAQLARFLDFDEGPAQARMIDNREWLLRYGLLDYLRDIGKHFTISAMLEKDSVQQRLGSGLSFTEFSYQTLQATDFLHLCRDQGVEMQMGGADQWGNITAGISLIRRVTGADRARPVTAAAAHRRWPEDGQDRAGLGDARSRHHVALRLLPVLAERG